MPHLRRALHRLATLFRFHKAERELAREVASHLQLLEDKHVERGMSREDARYAARREFGGVEQAKELHRDERSFRWLAGWPMDLKLGARMLVKSPGLTVIAVIALAVAFGAGATHLQFASGLVHPRFADLGGDRLIGVVVRDLERHDAEMHLLPEFRIWRTSSTRIEHLGAAEYIRGDVFTDDGRAITLNLDGVRITASAFRLAPVSPLMGRALMDADEDPAAPPVAVIGEKLWQSVFNRDPNILGASITLGRTRHTIVGVLPRTYGFPINHVLWVPFQDDGAFVKPGEGPTLSVFGRLADGARMNEAAAELAAVHSATLTGRRTRVEPYVASILTEDEGAILATLVYAINLVFIALLAVCAANVATLVFGRTVTRESELTVRAALGASRSRIVSQLIAEALVLASLAGIAGLTAARIGLAWVRPAWEQGTGSAMPFWWTEQLRPETILYTAVLVAFAALIVGGIPGLKATGRQMQTRLKYAGAGTTMKFGGLWTTIIVGQVAVTVVFLLSVVAMGWSIRTVMAQYDHVAFNRADYMAAWLNLPDDAETRAKALAHRQELIRRIARSPAVQNITYTTRMPGADQERTEIEVQGALAEVRVAHIGADFFETLGRPLIAGRMLTAGEIESGANVAIVDESFVRFVLNNRSAVGQQLRARDAKTGQLGPLIEMVGVTADVSTSPRKSITDARLYRPIGAAQTDGVNLIVHARAGYRTPGLGAVAAVLRETARTAPAGVQIAHMRTLDAGSGGDVIEYVFAALGIIGAVALLLSTAGIYALISFTLARRTREIGIRTALGASPRRIVTGILSRAMWQIGAGVMLGLLPGMAIVASVSAAEGRNGLVDGLWIGAAVAGFVLTVAAVSCAVPLRRALGIQPTEALRTT
ncbi:MAG TPA: ABC transporter permease [Vicinamibacterales bacterium]